MSSRYPATTIALAFSAALACGSSAPKVTSGTATATGSINGAPFTPADAASGNGFAQDTSAGGCLGNEALGFIVLRDVAGLCSDLRDTYYRQGAHELHFMLDTYDPACNSNPASAPGTYPINNHVSLPPEGQSAEATFYTFDSACKRTPAQGQDAVSGTVTITAVHGAGYQGSYDLAFAGGDHLAGTFTSGDCYGYSPPPSGESMCEP